MGCMRNVCLFQGLVVPGGLTDTSKSKTDGWTFALSVSLISLRVGKNLDGTWQKTTRSTSTTDGSLEHSDDSIGGVNVDSNSDFRTEGYKMLGKTRVTHVENSINKKNNWCVKMWFMSLVTNVSSEAVLVIKKKSGYWWFKPNALLIVIIGFCWWSNYSSVRYPISSKRL